MPCLRLVPCDFAGTSLFEALGRALMGFQLGHCFLDVLVILERDKTLRRLIGAETSRNLKAPLSIPESGFWRYGLRIARVSAKTTAQKAGFGRKSKPHYTGSGACDLSH